MSESLQNIQMMLQFDQAQQNQRMVQQNTRRRGVDAFVVFEQVAQQSNTGRPCMPTNRDETDVDTDLLKFVQLISLSTINMLETDTKKPQTNTQIQSRSDENMKGFQVGPFQVHE